MKGAAAAFPGRPVGGCGAVKWGDNGDQVRPECQRRSSACELLWPGGRVPHANTQPAVPYEIICLTRILEVHIHIARISLFDLL